MRALQAIFRIGGVRGQRRWVLAITVVLLTVVAVGSDPCGPPPKKTTTPPPPSRSWRWDIVSIDSTTTPPTIRAGGMATAVANDGSSITFNSATGTFRPNAATRRFSAIAKDGSGSWTTFDSTGAQVSAGTFTVRRGPAAFGPLPGTLTGVTDTIGDISLARAGFLLVDVEYSDGDRGLLGIACAFKSSPPAATDSPATAYEGVMATKGSTEYLSVGMPNSTVFHCVVGPCS